MNKIFLLVLSTLCLLAQPAISEDSHALNISKILDVDYAQIEGLGLYDRKSDGGLGRNFWRDTKRSTAVTLLKAMPARAQSPAIQRLINGVLLGSTDASLIENNIEPEPGEDLLTLRINKLIEGAQYEEAYSLYTMLEEPYHENLAQAGVLAMVYVGEKSTACLEGHSLLQRFSDSSFWQALINYCDKSLDIDNIEDDAGPLSALKEALLKAQDEKSGDLVSPDNKEQHIRALLDLELESLNESEDLLEAFKALYAAGGTIPQSWLKYAYKIAQQDKNKLVAARLLTAAYASKHIYRPSRFEKALVLQGIEATPFNTQLSLKNIIENIDNPPQTEHNAAKAYEKDFFLTARQDYVMPSYVVWDRLQNTSQTKAFAETVLLNTLLLSNETLHSIYPLILRDGMRSLEYLDLVNVSRDMALEAALGEIKN